MRIIIFTGQGGSGVSTVAAATALAAAAGGRRTLAFGLDRGLGAALDTPLGSEPASIAPNLRALEAPRRPDTPDDFRQWLRELLDWRGMEVALADDLAGLPGLNLVGALLEVEAHAGQGDADLIVVDCPPLDHCLDLLTAVDAAGRWLDRLFPIRQPTVFEPFLRALAGAAPSGDDVYEHGRNLLLRLARLRELLADADVGSLRLVLTADRPALAEAQQAVATLSLFAYPVEAAVVNRLLPPEVRDPFFDAVRCEQEEALRHLQGSLDPMPVLSSPLLPQAPRGVAALSGLAAALYSGHDPAAVLYRGPAHALSQRDGHYLLSLALPFARQEEIGLEQDGDNLIVQMGQRRRSMPLPQELRHLGALSYSFDGQVLNVRFEDKRAGQNAR